MPELPEAETIARQLRGRLPGRRLKALRVRRPSVVRGEGEPLRHLVGQTVCGVRRIGKAVLVEFAEGGCLLFRLGMTGALVVDGAGPLRPHCHLVLQFEPPLRVQFVDARRFGGVYGHTATSLAQAAEVRNLGVDPLSSAFTASWLGERLAGSRRPLKSFLMDQRVVAGIGNIYASEILFRAGLHPLRLANSLSSAEATRLRRETVRVLRAAISHGGTTVADYQDAEGRRGRFALRLLVYGREGEPCARCGRPIRRLVISNRSTFLCPGCQPAPRKRARRAAG